jgi:hypothetical protein
MGTWTAAGTGQQFVVLLRRQDKLATHVQGSHASTAKLQIMDSMWLLLLQPPAKAMARV